MAGNKVARRLFTGSRWRRAVSLTLIANMIGACQAGAGDVAHGGPGTAPVSITLVTYPAAEPGWSTVIPAFKASEEGKDVQVVTSYGASADQSRAVADGKPADVVNLSEPDISRLIKAGKVSKDWDKDATEGLPYWSVVTLVVRKGNPKNIHDWDDLLRPGVEVVTSSPLNSSPAKWSLLAPYAVKSNGGRDIQAGLEFISRMVNEHVKPRPGAAQQATDVFVRGGGDVLISSESEAIDVERRGKAIEHINPPQTIRIENPLAVVITSAHLKVATAFKNFQYTAGAQKLWADAGFRPVDPAVAAGVGTRFPEPVKLWTIAELGGWDAVEPQLFDKNTGSITRIYMRAIG